MLEGRTGKRQLNPTAFLNRVDIPKPQPAVHFWLFQASQTRMEGKQCPKAHDMSHSAQYCQSK